MTTNKRKTQQREASRKYRANKRETGLMEYKRKIQPAWKEVLDRVLRKLEKGLFE